MKPGNKFFFVLMFFIMFLFLLNLNKFIQGDYYNNKYYYSKVDTSGFGKAGPDVIKQEIFLNIETDFNKIKKIKYNFTTKIVFRLLNNESDTVKFNLGGKWTVKADFKFDYYHGIIAVHKDNLKKVGDKYTAVFSYSGKPPRYHSWIDGLSGEFLYDSTYNRVKSFLINSINPPFGARTWLLCHDNPADKVDTLIFNINIPDTLVAIANGRKQKMVFGNDGRVSYRYINEYPIATYQIALYVGPYRIKNTEYHSPHGYSMPVSLYAFPGVEEGEMDKVAERISYILEYFEKKVGCYPFADNGLKIVQHKFAGGMENQNTIGVSQISAAYELLYVHEIAHQWAGDNITPGFRHVWLSEGLATYLTALYIEDNIGIKEFYQYMNERKDLNNVSLLVNDVTDPDSLYTRVVYNKGAWVLHMMRKITGDKDFMHILNVWLSGEPKAVYKTSDFMRIAEAIYPYDWNAFARRWIYKGFVPEIKIIEKNGKRNLVWSNEDDHSLEVLVNNNGRTVIKKADKGHTEIFSNLENKIAEQLLRDYLCRIIY